MDVIVFAFPTKGAFTLGDRSVAAATPTSSVTWWSDTWNTRNAVSGGPAPEAKKEAAPKAVQQPPKTERKHSKDEGKEEKK